MKQRYLFRHGKKSDVKEVIGLIEARIEWMDAEGIRQWNVNHYRERYPESYFEQAAEARQMYVLEDERTARIVAAAILLTEDKRWGKAQGRRIISTTSYQPQRRKMPERKYSTGLND